MYSCILIEGLNFHTVDLGTQTLVSFIKALPSFLSSKDPFILWFSPLVQKQCCLTSFGNSLFYPHSYTGLDFNSILKNLHLIESIWVFTISSFTLQKKQTGFSRWYAYLFVAT